MSELNTTLYFRVAFLALLLHFASGDCVHLDLGMESRSIPDNNITASSIQSASTLAGNSRLNFASGSSWCAATNDRNPYLQIDLQTLHIICAVSTQGNSQAGQWVKTYKLQLSRDGSTWTNYKEGGQVKSFTGNEDRNSEVKHILYGGVLARYLRLMPETYNGGVCLRTEVFGVKLKPENLALGKPTIQSSTYSGNPIVGATVSDRAVDGNASTDMFKGHCSQTKGNNPSWWRVDLGADHVPVSQIYIVNRFSPERATKLSKDYEITLGSSADVRNNSKCPGRYNFIKFKASAVCFTDPRTTGRFVGIMTTTEQSLQLCEVEIYSRDNLAYNKTTSQSSTAHGGLSSRGVDGNSATSWAANSCTYTTKENKPWWRVDLGKEEQVSEVYIVNRDREGPRLSNFEIRVGTVSDHGGVTNPECGSRYSVPEGKGFSFFCRPPLYEKYVTVRSFLNVPLTVCEVEVYSERRACPIQAIGVASRDAIPDSSLSASSSKIGNEASKGRLYGDGAWLPIKKNDAKDYLQIDLLYEFVICAVATQGNPNADHWTTTYKLQLSYCGGSWVIYQENDVEKVFNGSSGRNDIVKHSLKEYASARFIRFQPITYKNNSALRVEVFGILLSTVPSQAPSGFTVVASTSTSITASWQLPPENARHGNITGFKLFYRKKDSMGPLLNLTVHGGEKHSEDITGLGKNTDYEFQVLAFTSVGDGPKSSIEVRNTRVDDKPVVVELPKRVILSGGELALLTCEVSGDPEPSVTWTKNGNTSIPRAQFKNDGRILVIKDVLPGDGGVYECKAFNKFGESRTSTTVVVAVPPSIIDDISPSLVICEMQILCSFSCHATSGSPLNYSWTKNGQVPAGDDIKIRNNAIILTPRDAEDYGVYVCQATNSFGSTAYKITVTESQKDLQNIFQAITIAFSTLVLALLVVIGVLVWRLRRAAPNNKASTTDKDIDVRQPVSDPDEYMELQPRPFQGQSRAPTEYHTLQGRPMTSGYCSVGFKGGNRKEESEEAYDSVEHYQS